MMLKPRSVRARRLAAAALLPAVGAGLWLTSLPVVAGPLDALSGAKVTNLLPERQTPAARIAVTGVAAADSTERHLTLFVDGREVADSTLKSIDASTISSVTVDKSSEAHPDGVMYITRSATKAAEPDAAKPDVAVRVRKVAYGIAATDGTERQPALFIDGREAEPGTLQSLDASAILSVVVDKSDKAYPDGVLYVTTRSAAKAADEAARAADAAAAVADEAARAADAAAADVEDKVYEVAEQLPSYPGGEAEMMMHLARTLRWPADQPDSLSGHVIVRFTVTTDGTVADPAIVRSPLPEAFGAEAIRAVRTLKFNPGLVNGKPVNCSYTLPVRYKGARAKKKKAQ